MAWTIAVNDAGGWDWSCFQSAYGAASGTADSRAAAAVELAIAEAWLMERPYAPALEAAMRARPQYFAPVYYPDRSTR
jgi:hypothetical protein